MTTTTTYVWDGSISTSSGGYVSYPGPQKEEYKVVNVRTNVEWTRLMTFLEERGWVWGGGGQDKPTSYKDRLAECVYVYTHPSKKLLHSDMKYCRATGEKPIPLDEYLRPMVSANLTRTLVERMQKLAEETYE